MKIDQAMEVAGRIDPAQEPPVLRVLLVEDNKHDARGITRALKRSEPPCRITHHVRAEDAAELLQAPELLFDVVVSDLNLPGMNGLEFCAGLARENPDLATVILTGQGSENVAVQALKAGVNDYLIKDPLGNYFQILPVVIPQAARQCRERIARIRAEEDRKRLIVELREALDQVKTLSGIIPICANCKKIRDDKGYWQQVEVYVRDHTEADFSHSLCFECMKALYPEIADELDNDAEACGAK